MAVNPKILAYNKKYLASAKKAAAGSSIFPAVILVASGLESNFGQSLLSKKYNNFFGIKDKNGVTLPTKEAGKNGNLVNTKAKFKVYKTPEESFKDYVRFISGPRYVKAGVTKAKTIKEQFAALKAAKYATDPNYKEKLLAVYNSGGPQSASFAGSYILALLAAGLIFSKNGKKKSKF